MAEREFHGNAETLSSEEKILFVNGWELLDRTRERSAAARGMDMTWRMQLRSDCKNLEKMLHTVEKTPTPANFKKLETAMLRLKTSADNILSQEDEW